MGRTRRSPGVRTGMGGAGGAGGTRLSPQDAAGGEPGGEPGRTAKEAAAQRQICFMVLSRRRREDAMRPPPPAPASTGTPEPGALRHRRPGGGRGCGSGSRTRLPPPPSLPPSLPPQHPPLRASLHPASERGPAPRLVPVKVGGAGAGAAPPPRAQKHPQNRAEHPPDSHILSPRRGTWDPLPCPGAQSDRLALPWGQGRGRAPRLHLTAPPKHPSGRNPETQSVPRCCPGSLGGSRISGASQGRVQGNVGKLRHRAPPAGGFPRLKVRSFNLCPHVRSPVPPSALGTALSPSVLCGPVPC